MRTASFLLLALLPPLAAQPAAELSVARFGLPACSGSGLELAPKHSFLICHSSSFKAPVWAAYELSPLQAASPVPALRREHFRRDRSLSLPGATDADYRSSGWSRGHLVPARDMTFDERARGDSFLLSNAVPQDTAMNRSLWLRLENRVRKQARSADSVIVITGAIYSESPERIGPGGVAVPAELYKVVLEMKDGHCRISAVIMPNEDASGSLESFAVSIAEVERRTGLRFFGQLDAAVTGEYRAYSPVKSLAR